MIFKEPNRIASQSLFALLIIFCVGFSVRSQPLSGDYAMDNAIRKMIVDLKMNENVKSKFIEVYKEYGAEMKDAQKRLVSRWSLYMVFLKASSERDDKMEKILNSSQYKLYLKRQKAIDKMASDK